MKCWVFLFFFITVTSIIAQEEVIPWSENRKLTWRDFKGTPNYNSVAAAITASGISYEFSASVKGNQVFVDYKVNSYFYPQNSWYNKEHGTLTVLKHEQLHFDITELHARKMRKILQNTTFTTKVKKQIKRVYNNIIKELQQMQAQYDAETDHSRNAEAQQKWEAKIAIMMKETRSLSQ